MSATDVELDPHQIRCVCFAWLINRHLMEMQDLALRGVRIWADLQGASLSRVQNREAWISDQGLHLGGKK